VKVLFSLSDTPDFHSFPSEVLKMPFNTELTRKLGIKGEFVARGDAMGEDAIADDDDDSACGARWHAMGRLC
jgi:hypothetical protein